MNPSEEINGAKTSEPAPLNPSSNEKPSISVATLLWIFQILLALAYTGAGFYKLLAPIERLHYMVWVHEVPTWVARGIGLLEIIFGLLLILPQILRIKPRLSIYAAFWFVWLMTIAFGYHCGKGAWEKLPMNFLMGFLSAFVAIGRAEILFRKK